LDETKIEYKILEFDTFWSLSVDFILQKGRWRKSVDTAEKSQYNQEKKIGSKLDVK
jgi:hypothetical protein